MHLDVPGGIRQRTLAPYDVDQSIDRDDFVAVEEQHREDEALLASTELDRPAFVVVGLQGPEYPQVHLPLARRYTEAEGATSAGSSRATRAQTPCKRAATPPQSLVAIDRIGRSPREKEPSMKTRHLRGVALFVTAASLAMSGTAVAGDVDANDLAHYGRNQSPPSALPSAMPATARDAVVVRVDGGFDWLDAGVGAAGSLGFALALGGAVSTVRRYRSDAAAMPEQSLTKGA
jgi:hypothetical protein